MRASEQAGASVASGGERRRPIIAAGLAKVPPACRARVAGRLQAALRGLLAPDKPRAQRSDGSCRAALKRATATVAILLPSPVSCCGALAFLGPDWFAMTLNWRRWARAPAGRMVSCWPSIVDAMASVALAASAQRRHKHSEYSATRLSEREQQKQGRESGPWRGPPERVSDSRRRGASARRVRAGSGGNRCSSPRTEQTKKQSRKHAQPALIDAVQADAGQHFSRASVCLAQAVFSVHRLERRPDDWRRSSRRRGAHRRRSCRSLQFVLLQPDPPPASRRV